MSATMLRYILIFLGMALAVRIVAQRQVEYAEKDFFQLRDQLRQHFENLWINGEEEAFREGGDFTEFKKWDEFTRGYLKNS